MAHDFDPNSAAQFDGIYGLPHTCDEARVVLVPVPWEATVSYGSGTADGPAAILAASRQVDLLDRDTGRPYQAGIAMLDIPGHVRGWSDSARHAAQPVIAAGGAGEDAERLRAAAEVDALGERMHEWVYDMTARGFAAGKLMGVVGGDHSTPLGAIRAAAERHKDLGVLHVDAHADLREAYEGFRYSHASIMNNVLRDTAVLRIVQAGVRDYCEDEERLIRDNPTRVRTWFDADLRRDIHTGESWAHLVGRIVADLPREVWVSFDIDGLDPSLCPHTGTPVPGGLSFPEAVTLLRHLAASGRRIVGFDLCEVAPDPTGRTQWDANVGARLLYKLIGFTLMSQPE